MGVTARYIRRDGSFQDIKAVKALQFSKPKSLINNNKILLVP